MDDSPAQTRSDRKEFPAVDPVTGKATATVVITLKRAQRVASRGYGAVLEMAYNVPEVLRNPSVGIFEGIRWDEDEDRSKKDKVDTWLCYCGHPRNYYDPNDNRPQPSGRDEVFLVFVNVEGVAYHWLWDDVDEDGSGNPRGWRTRFQRKAL